MCFEAILRSRLNFLIIRVKWSFKYAVPPTPTWSNGYFSWFLAPKDLRFKFKDYSRPTNVGGKKKKNHTSEISSVFRKIRNKRRRYSGFGKTTKGFLATVTGEFKHSRSRVPFLSSRADTASPSPDLLGHHLCFSSGTCHVLWFISIISFVAASGRCLEWPHCIFSAPQLTHNGLQQTGKEEEGKRMNLGRNTPGEWASHHGCCSQHKRMGLDYENQLFLS